MNMYEEISPEIWTWLQEVDDVTWKQMTDNPNIFMSNHLEGLYVYNDKVTYIEDIRASSLKVMVDKPTTKAELWKILYPDTVQRIAKIALEINHRI